MIRRNLRTVFEETWKKPELVNFSRKRSEEVIFADAWQMRDS